MEDRQKTLAALTIIAGAIVLLIIVVGAFVSGKKIVSPVPEEGAIKIIFITPTPAVVLQETPTPTPTKKVTPKPTPKPTVTPTSTASATPKP